MGTTVEYEAEIDNLSAARTLSLASANDGLILKPGDNVSTVTITDSYTVKLPQVLDCIGRFFVFTVLVNAAATNTLTIATNVLDTKAFILWAGAVDSVVIRAVGDYSVFFSDGINWHVTSRKITAAP